MPKYESYVGGPKIIVPTGSPPTPGRTQDLSGGGYPLYPNGPLRSSVSYDKSFGSFDGFAHIAARYRGARNVTSEQNPIADQDSYVTRKRNDRY